MQDIKQQFYETVNTHNPKHLRLIKDLLVADWWLEKLSLAVEQEKERVAKELNELYTEFENEPLPVLSNTSERNWNEGFKQGRLTAMEKTTQKITGKTGDDLINNK